MRAEPFCQHYGVCGGCKWQCLSYQDQIRYKQKQVYDNLTRIGKVELPEFMPILGSEKTMFYRNKLEFTFSNKRWLTEEEVKQDVKYDQMNAVGFHIRELSIRYLLSKSVGCRMIFPIRSVMQSAILLTNIIMSSSICAVRKVCSVI